MNRELLEEKLSELPLYIYDFFDPQELEFSDRIRWICRNECPKYGTTWACPPGVGTVAECQKKCMSYENCLLISLPRWRTSRIWKKPWRPVRPTRR